MRKTSETPMKYVYRFSEGNTSMASLLGGKGANLADIARLATAQAALGNGQREDV